MKLYPANLVNAMTQGLYNNKLMWQTFDSDHENYYYFFFQM